MAASRPGRAGRVGVHVGRDAQALARAPPRCGRSRRPSSASSPCRLPSGDRSPPARPSARAIVDQSRRRPRPGRLPSLRMCVDVDAAAAGGASMHERDELVGLREARGRVDQRRADAERAFLHRLLHERPASLCSCSGVGSTSSDARGRARARSPRRRSEATFIETPFVSEELEVLAERRPLDRVLEVDLLRDESPSSSAASSGPMDSPSPITSSVTPWRSSPCARPSIEERLGGPGEHVDEAGRDRLARRVDLALAPCPAPCGPT